MEMKAVREPLACVRFVSRVLLWLAVLAAFPLPLSAADEKPSSGDAATLAAQILDTDRPMAERQALIAEHPELADELIAAMRDGLEVGTPQEYQRIPYLWRVSVAAGERNNADQLRTILDLSLPRDDEPLRDWQAVVVGGGVVGGTSNAGVWPRDRIAEILAGHPELIQRWNRSLKLAKTMADDPQVRNPTRYDALRMLGAAEWSEAGDGLLRYLGEGNERELQMGAVSGLADMQSPHAIRPLVDALSHLTGTNRQLAIEGLLRNDARIAALLGALESGSLTPAELNPEQIKKLRAVENPELRARAEKLLGE